MLCAVFERLRPGRPCAAVALSKDVAAMNAAARSYVFRGKYHQAELTLKRWTWQHAWAVRPGRSTWSVSPVILRRQGIWTKRYTLSLRCLCAFE